MSARKPSARVERTQDARATLRPPSVALLPPIQVDTSRHSIEHDCPHCEANKTGLWAQLEILAKHRTKILTEALYRQVVALCITRGTVRQTREAA